MSWCINIRFNFAVPKIYLRRSLVYFFIISLFSFSIQKVLKNYIIIEQFDYNLQRLFFSGTFFIIGYFFHLAFTFKKIISVGVAIYANGHEELDKIKSKIENILILFMLMLLTRIKRESADLRFFKVRQINFYLRKKHTHIMSKTPMYIIDKVINFLKLFIYIMK